MALLRPLRPRRGAKLLLLRRASVAAAVALAALFPALAQDGPAPDRGSPDLEVFEQAWRILRDQFYDRGYRGVDWDAVYARHVERARSARDARELHEAIIEMIGELHSSHVALVEPDVFRDHYDNEAKGTLAWRHGLELVQLDGGFFVGEVAAGSAAEAAYVLRGDRLAQLDGHAPDRDSLRPAPWDAGLGGQRGWFLALGHDPRRPVVLTLQRRENGKRTTFTTQVVAMQWSDNESVRASVRIHVVRGIPIGYVRLYHLLSEEVVDILAEALAGPLAQSRAVVVDLRGRGGLPSAADRVLELFDPQAPGGPRYNRPAVAAVDGETRSAKEILAWSWRERGIGPVVGERTRGAVLGARFLELHDRSMLLVPNFDLRAMTGGVVLEGKGVEPDVLEKDWIPFAQGHDPIAERAIEVAFEQVLKWRRTGRTHGWY
jgi:carboxyl-terminal processing protease